MNLDSKTTPILLVEDSMMMRQIMQTGLSNLGYMDVSTASDGLVALEKIQEAKKDGKAYGIIFLDWGLPGMDGLSLLKKCRANSEFDKVAIVMLTAVSDQKCIIEALDAGATAYITKPFTPEIIEEKLKQIAAWAGLNS